jgi:hypothetical protein
MRVISRSRRTYAFTRLRYIQIDAMCADITPHRVGFSSSHTPDERGVATKPGTSRCLSVRIRTRFPLVRLRVYRSTHAWSSIFTDPSLPIEHSFRSAEVTESRLD